MKIIKSEFIISNTDVSKCPKDAIPEYAFIGRSNVGKSSLINMITGRTSLAKTSSTPGKTQLINHFKINDKWFLVDLPGYGYAKVSKSKRHTFQEFIKDYFNQREQLVCTFVLVDSRHAPQKIDVEFMQWLGENEIPFGIVFTKADKLKLSQLNANVLAYKKELLQTWEELPVNFVTSSAHKEGGEELLKYIESVNNDVKDNFR